MKALFTCLPEYGHFHPMAPTARALMARGHEVAFATAADFCSRVQRAGFTAFPAGLAHAEQVAEARRRYPAEAALPAGQERFLAFVPRMVAGVAAPARAPELARIVRRWRPDILVHDEVELAAPVIAAAACLPYVAHGVGLLRPHEALRLAGEVLVPLCEEWTVELNVLGGIFAHLYLDVTPPSMRAPYANEVPVIHSVNTSTFDSVADEHLPDWVLQLPRRPTVYVTMGTLFNANLDVFRSILEALGEESVNVIITVGHDANPNDLGPVPPHVRVTRYIPQSRLLPHCDVVVAQGGWSVVGMLANGLPMLLLPQGANQFWHAEACVAAGAARQLLPSEVSPTTVRLEVRRLLDAPVFRQRARWMAGEIASMPSPDLAAGLVEQVWENRRSNGLRPAVP